MIEATAGHGALRYEDEGEETDEKLDGHVGENSQEADVFGNEEHAEVKYKVLTWW